MADFSWDKYDRDTEISQKKINDEITQRANEWKATLNAPVKKESVFSLLKKKLFAPKVIYRIRETKYIEGSKIDFTAYFSPKKNKINYVNANIDLNYKVSPEECEKIRARCVKISKDFRIAYDEDTRVTLLIKGKHTYEILKKSISYSKMSPQSEYYMDRSKCHEHYFYLVKEFKSRMVDLFKSELK